MPQRHERSERKRAMVVAAAARLQSIEKTENVEDRRKERDREKAGKNVERTEGSAALLGCRLETSKRQVPRPFDLFLGTPLHTHTQSFSICISFSRGYFFIFLHVAVFQRLRVSVCSFSYSLGDAILFLEKPRNTLGFFITYSLRTDNCKDLLQ